jgi:hypothetical protein
MWQELLITALDSNYTNWRSDQVQFYVSRNTIMNWERRRNFPSRRTMEKFLKVPEDQRENVLDAYLATKNGSQRRISLHQTNTLNQTLLFNIKTTAEIYYHYLMEALVKTNPPKDNLPRRPDIDVTQLQSIHPIVEQQVQILLGRKGKQIFSIEGVGGIGKTTFAYAIAQHLKTPTRDDLLRGQYAIGQIIWVTVDRAKDKESLKHHRRIILESIGQELDVQRQVGQDLNHYTEELLKLMQIKSCLIIIDNIEHCEEIAPVMDDLDRLRSATPIILTSRHRLANEYSYVRSYTVQPLDMDHAHQLLSQHLEPLEMHISKIRTQSIYAHTGGNPQALTLVGGLLASQVPFDVVLKALQNPNEQPAQNGDDIAQNGDDIAQNGEDIVRQRMLKLFNRIYRAIWERLEVPCRDLYVVLSDIPAGGINETDMQSLLHETQKGFGATYNDYHDCLKTLIGWHIVMPAGGVGSVRYTMHALTRAFIQAGLNGDNQTFESAF